MPGAGTGTRAVAASPVVLARITVSELIQSALDEIQAVGIGQTMDIADANLGLRYLNRMLDSWSLRQLFVYKQEITRYNITPVNQTSYTIGPTGNFVAERPTKITGAFIVVVGGTAPLPRYKLEIIETAADWAELSATQYAAEIPSKLYYDKAYPDGRLWLWGYPATANDLELVTWDQLSAFNDLADSVSLPPGYEEAIMYSLAEKLCGPFEKEVPAELARQARRARALIAQFNSKPPRLSADSGIPA